MQVILLLEDEILLMKLLRRMLMRYTVIEATSAQQAIELFTEYSGRIDCLIADVNLPISSGPELALQLRSMRGELPVILTSGFPVSGWSEKDRADLEKLDSDTVLILQKPFSREAVLSAVVALIGAPESGAMATP
jgi:CheY-like chemotaxis protein